MGSGLALLLRYLPYESFRFANGRAVGSAIILCLIACLNDANDDFMVDDKYTLRHRFPDSVPHDAVYTSPIEILIFRSQLARVTHICTMIYTSYIARDQLASASICKRCATFYKSHA